MQEIKISVVGKEISQAEAQGLGQVIAQTDNPETMAISRYNRLANSCSPCCLGGHLGNKPGWEVYGENHGGRLRISINDGDYIFIFS